MIIAAMADANEEELEDEKEESDVFLNTKDLREAMAGLDGVNDDDEEEEESKVVETKAAKKLK